VENLGCYITKNSDFSRSPSVAGIPKSKMMRRVGIYLRWRDSFAVETSKKAAIPKTEKKMEV
jgi:hypothetical protein